jgi:geranylgeranyl reductase family protein
MNLAGAQAALPPLPDECDVLVVGGGPAGSAAARWLALRGLRVVLADRRTFPRHKVCGDGLISDALEACSTLGLRERVAQKSVHVTELRVYPPVGRHVSLSGDFACVPRHDLDLLLWDAAVEAGAIGRSGLDAVHALESGGHVAGARFRTPQGDREIRARMTILATGANSTTLGAFGLGVPGRPNAVAGRAYFEAPSGVTVGRQPLVIAYDLHWCPGYGWIFPSPGNRFNIGVGLFTSASASRLREFWRAFTTRFAPAARIVRESEQLTPFQGAPIRSGLTGAGFGRPGMLAVGEAAAMTYSATGEGIGKALESGMMAAATAAACLEGRESIETAHERYGEEFRARFLLRYRAYEVAQAWAAHPLVLSVLAARARAGRFARGELEALIAERGDLRRLFSVSGLLAALVR